ncbi:MAG: Arabinose 5-phosphate isomerase KdsD [Phycisphaerae bacterium]|nr:Arabinose 5-phosphate isomerase KdsD [Phycisphaerae bacterium]
MKSATPPTLDPLEMGRRVLILERQAIEQVITQLDEHFRRAIELLMACRGRVIVTGMGKAGLIGAKIAATLSSTGTPAYTLHPVEAIHGDLGMVGRDDVVLALSNSGESDELYRLIPNLKKMGCPVILITGRPNSRCAQQSDLVLSIGRVAEACPLGMAPSSSTTAILALGDALALVLSELKEFDHEQYAQLHPGGALGRSLMRVEQVMRTGANCPMIPEQATIYDYLQAVNSAPMRAGAAVVIDDLRHLIGFFTHGDLARIVGRLPRPGECLLREVMTRNPKRVSAVQLVSDALILMQQHKIDEIPVVDEQERVAGLIDIQDLLAAGFSLFDAN